MRGTLLRPAPSPLSFSDARPASCGAARTLSSFVHSRVSVSVLPDAQARSPRTSAS